MKKEAGSSSTYLKRKENAHAINLVVSYGSINRRCPGNIQYTKKGMKAEKYIPSTAGKYCIYSNDDCSIDCGNENNNNKATKHGKYAIK